MPPLEHPSPSLTRPPQHSHRDAAFNPLAAMRTARARLRPLDHPPEHDDGIPYYDDEFDMAQSTAHSKMVRDLSQFLEQLAPSASLQVFSDNPIWYWVSETNQQKPFYPDYALADAAANPKRLTALDLRLVIELVSIATPAKEQKDSVRMRELNANNGVPEFVLFYPEPEDQRAVRWFSLDQTKGGYREWDLPADWRYCSQAVPGLEVEVLPPELWQSGRKARLWYRGDRLAAVDEAVFMAEQAICQLGEERHAREAAQRIAQQEQQARETAEHIAQQEQQARKAAEHQAQQAQAENARLLARLREAGLVP